MASQECVDSLQNVIASTSAPASVSNRNEKHLRKAKLRAAHDKKKKEKAISQAQVNKQKVESLNSKIKETNN